MEPKMFRGQEPNNASCQAVERLTDEKINGVRDRVKATEHDLRELKDGMDEGFSQVREEASIRNAELHKRITDHEKDVNTNFTTIHTQLLQRVPAWIMSILMAGASIIGAMAMWILDHLKH